MSRAIFDAPTIVARLVADGRDGQGDVDGRPSLRTRTVSKCSTRSPASEPREDRVLLVARSAGMIERDVPADGLRRGVAEEPLGRRVPGLDHAVQRLADDGVLGRLDDGRQEPRALSASPLPAPAPPSVTSRKTRTQPATGPLRFVWAPRCRRSGAPCRLCAIRTVWLARPTIGAFPQRPDGRVLDRLPRLLVDDAEDASRGCPTASLRPACQRLGHRVQDSRCARRRRS